ncbi:post-GPI attachment to proteins factor 6 [Rhinatrema bivittatum]|uniref:post-GPI attachment to proteins factor 6 n=1 Tax=Rhinatrema bivittatum TaxID=194408 RepID=UPI0011278ABD|nr:post-GPI attachment to proteins factor 6 [Rhinatrema bivittatum]
MGVGLMLLPFILLLLLSGPSAGIRDQGGVGTPRGSSEDLIYATEYFSQNAQRLSSYDWYGSVRLFHFRVPKDTVLLRWLLQASRGKGPECKDVEVAMYIRHGAPPVINPLGTHFAASTSVRPSYNQTLLLTSMLLNNTFINISNPASGDWFIAAHLPKQNAKIQIQGFSTSCTYIFQPDMFVMRLVNIPVLEMDTPLQQTIVSPMKPARLKVFIPEFTLELKLQLGRCKANNTELVCPVTVMLGSVTLPQSYQQTVDCTGKTNCSVVLTSPPWDRWLQVTIESNCNRNTSVTYEVTASLTGCQPAVTSSSSFLSFYQSLNLTHNRTDIWESPLDNGTAEDTALLAADSKGNASTRLLPVPVESPCLRQLSVIREDLDAVSVQFRTVNGASVTVLSQYPIAMPLDLNSVLDSGGMLVVSLLLNKTSLSNANASVLACLSPAAPVLSLNTTGNCSTALFQGYPFQMNLSVPEGVQRLPYPESEKWYLALQVVCPWSQSECKGVSAKVVVSAYLSPCLNDCGTYGVCKLLRRHGYLYAACNCKAGWSGWSCTDSTSGLSISQQLLATMLLTLSNLMFIPAIVVAAYRYHIVEASVYIYTMFFSTFYHACDQPGIAVMCIMDYDTLQYCDFLGSVVSIWVTVLCMSRIKKLIKYVLFILGTLLIAMSMQLDRRGVWNMMGPCLFAIIVLILAWVYRGVKRRHCYPPSWKRWVFFLLPGALLALIAVTVYACLETNQNYFYTHSLWHILVAGSVAFLLPPREKHKKPWLFLQKLKWKNMCKDDHEELYVTT